MYRPLLLLVSLQDLKELLVGVWVAREALLDFVYVIDSVIEFHWWPLWIRSTAAQATSSVSALSTNHAMREHPGTSRCSWGGGCTGNATRRKSHRRVWTVRVVGRGMLQSSQRTNGQRWCVPVCVCMSMAVMTMSVVHAARPAVHVLTRAHALTTRVRVPTS